MPLLRSALLKAEPAGSLASLDELFALANAMEQEAATRYAQLAEEMARQGKSALATAFSAGRSRGAARRPIHRLFGGRRPRRLIATKPLKFEVRSL